GILAVNTTCFGDSSGFAIVNPVGGIGVFDYKWSHLPTLNNDTALGLAFGKDLVTISDVVGCNLTDSVFVNQPAEFQANFDTINPLCGDTNGIIYANVMGGTPATSGYNLEWLTPQKQPFIP